MVMTRLESLARWLVLILGLGTGAACAGGDPIGAAPAPAAKTPAAPATEDPTRAALEAEAQDDLARLRALNLVEVIGLHLPDQKTYCYGNPCPDGPAWQEVVDQTYPRQVPRLTLLTELAEQAARATDVAPADPKGAESDLSALKALNIVDVGDLLQVAPADNPHCYNLPCPEDIEAAADATARKAGVVARWVQLSLSQHP